jgi:hypothetical protein
LSPYSDGAAIFSRLKVKILYAGYEDNENHSAKILSRSGSSSSALSDSFALS